MKKTQTRRALLMSALSLLLCVSMLVGSTFAWFTDSVVSANNVIKSGNLDIEVQYTLDGENWKDLNGAKDLFQKDLWEPGHVEVVALKIENKGSLALKYTAGMNIVDEIVGKTKDGKNIVLSDILTVKTLNHQTGVVGDITVGMAFDKRETTLDYETNTAFKAASVLDQDQELQPGAGHYLIVRVEMAETVGNEANHDGVNAPSITFGINVLATQYTYEEDSFDDQYDVNATYLSKDAEGAWVINNMDELFFFANEVNGGKTYKGETVKLNADIDMAGYMWKPIQQFAGTFEGNGKTISNLSIKGGSNVAFFNHVQTTAKIQNVTFDKANVSGEHYVAVVLAWEGNETANALIKNVKVTNSTVTGAVVNNDNGDKIGAIAGYAVTLNIEDCSVENTTVTGYRDVGGILGYAHKKVVVKNNTVKDSSVVCDASVNYKNYTKTDEYDIEAIVGEAVATAVVENNTATNVKVVAPADLVVASTADELLAAVNAGATEIHLAPYANFRMPDSSTNKTVKIIGNSSAVIDMTWGAYWENAKVTFENVTFKTTFGYVKGNGSDYAAFYSPDVVYNDCTFNGGMLIGRDGAQFNGCTFNVTSDYVRAYGNDVTFEGCTFNTVGKAILVYSDGGNEVAEMSVKNCKFYATTGAKAGAIANQNCAAIEIHNYGNGVNLVTAGNTHDANFSGEWRIKTYEAGKPKVFVNGVEYTTLALDGKTMTIDANKNVTVN